MNPSHLIEATVRDASPKQKELLRYFIQAVLLNQPNTFDIVKWFAEQNLKEEMADLYERFPQMTSHLQDKDQQNLAEAIYRYVEAIHLSGVFALHDGYLYVPIMIPITVARDQVVSDKKRDVHGLKDFLNNAYERHGVEFSLVHELYDYPELFPQDALVVTEDQFKALAQGRNELPVAENVYRRGARYSGLDVYFIVGLARCKKESEAFRSLTFDSCGLALPLHDESFWECFGDFLKPQSGRLVGFQVYRICPALKGAGLGAFCFDAFNAIMSGPRSILERDGLHENKKLKSEFSLIRTNDRLLAKFNISDEGETIASEIIEIADFMGYFHAPNVALLVGDISDYIGSGRITRQSMGSPEL